MNEEPLLLPTSEKDNTTTATTKEKDGASSFETALNMLNELEGQGLLGLPYAASLVGITASATSLLLVGALAAFTGYLINGCMYDSIETTKRVRVSSSYAELGRRTFGLRGERFVMIIQMTNLSFVGVVYLVLMGNALHNVYTILTNDDTSDRRLWIAFSTLAAFPTVHLGGYKKIYLLSFVGLVAIISIFVFGVYFSSRELSDHGHAPLPEFKLINLPSTISIFLFAFSAHGIFPDLEDSMSDKSKFTTVVTSVFATNILLKAIFTFLGALAYGDATGQILTENFSSSRVRSAVNVLIAVNIIMSFPLPLIPVFNAIRKYRNSESKNFQNFLVRSAIVIACGAVAVGIPDFGTAMGLMGSITLPFLTFIFPGLFFVRLHGTELALSFRFLCYFVVVFGAFGAVLGLFSNIYNIIH